MLINIYELRLIRLWKSVRFTDFLCLFFIVFVCFAVNGFAQNLDSISEKINYGNAEQRRDALLQIKILQTAETSRLAVALLSDSNEIIRATAVSAVIYLPSEEALTYLLPLLKDKSEIVRRETVYAIGKTQNPKAVSPLIEIFQRDKILEVQNAAIIALGEIGNDSAVDFLVKILQKKPTDESEFLRRAAARSIGQIAEFIQTGQTKAVTPANFLPENLKTNEKSNLPNLIVTIPVFGNAVNILIQVLVNPKESDDTKREAAFALGEIRSNSAISVLQSNLNNPDYYLVEICREALEKIKLNNNK